MTTKATARKKAATKKAPEKKKAASNKAAKKTTKKSAKKSDMKTVATKASVTQFIAAVENEDRKKDAKKLLTIMKKVTGEKPVMWGSSMIGFGSYHYKYESGREGDFMNVGFSPRKANLVLYVLGSLDDYDPLLKKLGKHKRGRACLYLNRLDDVDQAVLEKIIDNSYRTTIKRWS